MYPRNVKTPFFEIRQATTILRIPYVRIHTSVYTFLDDDYNTRVTKHIVLNHSIKLQSYTTYIPIDYNI